MAGDKQKTLKGNTNEYLFGVEWNALDWLDVSSRCADHAQGGE